MPPRLLVIVGRFVIGGHATDNIPLLYALKSKYTIKVIYGEKEADEMEPHFLLSQYPGLDVEKLPAIKRSIHPFADLVAFIRVYRLIKRFKPDIVHTHGAKAGITGRLAAHIAGVKVIVHTFHGHLFHSYFNRFVSWLIIKLEQIMASVTDAAIALSSTQKHELSILFKIFPPAKLHEIPLGIFKPKEKYTYPQHFRNRFHLTPDDVAVGIVGRIAPIKNHLEFLKIASLVLNRGYKNVKFFIIGDGDERTQLINYLHEQNISFTLPGEYHGNAPIVFTSWVTHIYQVMYELDILVLTSRNEGTPISMIEAQLCSKPVVAYDVGGVRDTLVDHVSGFLVEPGNTASFAEKLVQLIDDETLRIRMGEEGKAFASAKFSKRREVASIDRLYTSLLDKYVNKKSNN